MRVIKAPDPLPLDLQNGIYRDSVFLAGSIEMGTAKEWQTELTTILKDSFCQCIFNPRRDSWDNSWEQSINNSQFNTQVNWELTAQDMAEHIFMHFLPNSKSPISLLELGLYAASKKMIVCCPTGFWRKGNVEVVCYRYNIPLYEDFDEAVYKLKCNLSVDRQ